MKYYSIIMKDSERDVIGMDGITEDYFVIVNQMNITNYYSSIIDITITAIEVTFELNVMVELVIMEEASITTIEGALVKQLTKQHLGQEPSLQTSF